MGGNATRMGSLLLGPVARLRALAPPAVRPGPAGAGPDLLAVVAGGARPRGGERAALGQRRLLRAARRLPARSARTGLPAGRGASRGASLGVRLRPARASTSPAAGSASSTASSIRSSTSRRPLTGTAVPRAGWTTSAVGYVAVPRRAARLRGPGEKRLIKQGPALVPREGLPQQELDRLRGSQPVAARDRGRDGQADARRASWSTRARRAPSWSECTGRRTGRSSRAPAASSRPRAATR